VHSLLRNDRKAFRPGNEGDVKLKIGPIKVRFTGIVTLSDLDPPNGYTITGEDSGGVAGFAKGSAAVRLVFEGRPSDRSQG
jgi:carbon monoxide dehydrogenase subunit G